MDQNWSSKGFQTVYTGKNLFLQILNRKCAVVSLYLEPFYSQSGSHDWDWTGGQDVMKHVLDLLHVLAINDKIWKKYEDDQVNYMRG